MSPRIGGVSLLHTAQVDPALLQAARRLSEAVFDREFDDADWDHALGGLHALVQVDGDLVAHGALVQRRLLHGGRTLRVGYVEAIVVHPVFRGHASAVMAALEEVVGKAYDAAALSGTDEGALLYASRGWQRWLGTTWALMPQGGSAPRRTTMPSSCCLLARRSTSPVSSPATGATATSGERTPAGRAACARRWELVAPARFGVDRRRTTQQMSTAAARGVVAVRLCGAGGARQWLETSVDQQLALD